MAFIITSARHGVVAAPSGFSRRKAGDIYQDGTDRHKSSPETSKDSTHAYLFASRLKAQRQANKLIDGKVKEVDGLAWMRANGNHNFNRGNGVLKEFWDSPLPDYTYPLRGF